VEQPKKLILQGKRDTYGHSEKKEAQKEVAQKINRRTFFGKKKEAEKRENSCAIN